MFRKTTLESGLRVITENLAHTKSVTVLVLVAAGGRYEKIEQRGLSHFLEHMFFKGALRYKSTREVSEAIDSVGGTFNAFTGKEYAGYYVKVSSDFLKTSVDVLSDMLVNSMFKQEEIEKERGVILEEYNMYQDTPMYQIGWNFEKLVLGDQPLGWDQIGTKEVIKSLNHEDFMSYFKELYTPDNTVIAVVGDIDHNNVLEMVSEYFVMDDREKAFDAKPFEKMETEKITVMEKKTEQAHLAIGFPGLSEQDSDHWALKLLSVILGGNMSSRMFLGVREAKGLAYYIRSSLDSYQDAGTFVTTAGVDLNRIDEAIESILFEYSKVKKEGITEQELKRAKAYLKGRIVLNLEDSEEFAHMLAKYELLRNKVVSPSEVYKLIDSVKMEDINRVIEKIFVEQNLKMALIGPFSDVDKQRFEKMLKF